MADETPLQLTQSVFVREEEDHHTPDRIPTVQSDGAPSKDTTNSSTTATGHDDDHEKLERQLTFITEDCHQDSSSDDEEDSVKHSWKQADLDFNSEFMKHAHKLVRRASRLRALCVDEDIRIQHHPDKNKGCKKYIRGLTFAAIDGLNAYVHLRRRMIERALLEEGFARHGDDVASGDEEDAVRGA